MLTINCSTILRGTLFGGDERTYAIVDHDRAVADAHAGAMSPAVQQVSLEVSGPSRGDSDRPPWANRHICRGPDGAIRDTGWRGRPSGARITVAIPVADADLTRFLLDD